MADRAIASAMFIVLLDHLSSAKKMKNLNPYALYPKGYLLSYGTLCDRAGVPFMARSAGGPLKEIAEYCLEAGWPPINALAVNGESRYPGDGYFTAPGCGDDWVDAVKKVIEFPNYPKKAPILS